MWVCVRGEVWRCVDFVSFMGVQLVGSFDRTLQMWVFDLDEKDVSSC